MCRSPEASVVMAVHNGEAYLREAVESILRQTYRDYEFIIVDDGSTDATTEILREYERKDNRVRVHRQDNRGQATALNTGCELAEGKYIARMDADDISFEDRLERQVAILAARASCALVGGAIVLMNSDGTPLLPLHYPSEDAEIRQGLIERNMFAHPAVVMTKEAFDGAGGYRPALAPAEDWDLWLRITELYEVANLADPVLYYRVHPQQLSLVHLHQQVLSALGARWAARLRREGRKDPISGSEPVSLELVTQMGMDEATYGKTLALTRWWWRQVAEAAGYGELAAHLRDELERGGRSPTSGTDSNRKFETEGSHSELGTEKGF